MANTNWLAALKAHLTGIKGAGWTSENLVTIQAAVVAIKAITNVLPNAGALSDLAAILLDTGTDGVVVDSLTAGGVTAITNADASAQQTNNLDHLLKTAMAAALDTIVGDDTVFGFMLAKSDVSAFDRATDSLEAISDKVSAVGAGQAYQEQIPDTDFTLASVDTTLSADPPSADAPNSVVDIDVVSGKTHVLRSLWVNVTSFGTGTKLIFKLWTLLNTAVTMVDSVDVTATGIQTLMDLFGLPEVHADGIWITVQTDVGTTGACSGTYRYATAST